MRCFLLRKLPAAFSAVLAATVPLAATVSFAPALPNVEQTVTFTVSDSYTIDPARGLTWNFGDGSTALVYTTTTTHVYMSMGNFAVRVDYWANPAAGQAIQRIGQATVSVSERRKISFRPAKPVVGQAVSFKAENFLAPSVRWDFGDGTPPLTAGVTAAHTYLQPGTFTVTALDNGGASAVSIRASVTVNVGETVGPRANFKISFLQLRFDDGKAYKVVPKGAEGLMAFADIKVEGTGLLHLEWLVDGAPFRQATRALSFAQTAVMDSGRLPGLPTNVAGLHEVTLRIISPGAEFTVPVIRYFVTAGRAAPAAAAGVVLEIESAAGLDGLSLLVAPGKVRLPEGGTCILKGLLRNEAPTAVALGLLRVTVDGGAIDLQLVRNLQAGEGRAFLTSFQRSPGGPAGKTQTVFISFYDISRKTANVLAAKKVEVVY